MLNTIGGINWGYTSPNYWASKYMDGDENSENSTIARELMNSPDGKG